MKPNIPLLIAAAIAIAVWLVALGLAAVRNRPNHPDVAPETTELGPEPPAVVNLLVQDFRVTNEAVPATLLDLAARRRIDIELIGGNRHVLRLRRERPGDLTAYEKQVLDHVASLAVGDIVPAEALTTGPRDVSKQWWNRFRDGVITEAQNRGLSVNRWSKAALSVLGFGAIIPGVLYLAAIHFDTDNAFDTVEDGVVAGALAGVVALLVMIGGSKRQRDLPAGLAAAGRWLGVRNALARNRQFAIFPPSAVAIWERALAVAAAMGLARGATEGLPLGAEDDRVAWSSEGGQWRRVTVRYPRFRPLWGRSPTSATIRALAFGIPALLILIFVARFDRPESLSASADRWVVGVQTLLMLTVGAVVLGMATILLRALTDMRASREMTGTVLRLRRRSTGQEDTYKYFVALDDGTASRIDAFVVRKDLYDTLSQGERVTLRLTPRLRYVLSASTPTAPL